MNSPAHARDLSPGRRCPRWLAAVVMMVALPLLATLGAAPAAATPTLCLPGPEAACIAGTLRTESEVLGGVEVTVSGPDGFEETVTTGDDGKWSLQVTTEGEYTVAINEESLPEGAVTDGEATVDATFGVTKPALIEIRSADYSSERDLGQYLLQSAVNGLRLGLLLALASIGLSLIYGTTGLSSFSHAEQVALGGILAHLLVNRGGMNLWLGGLVVVLICGFSGWFQDRIMWQPLRRRGLGLTQLMIVTIGLSLAMQYAFQYTVGARTVRVVRDNPDVFSLGPVTTTYQSVAAMLISIIVISAVGFALLRTRVGRATRAVSDNPALAAASGIDVDKVIRLVWTVSCALAGLSGILYALVVNGIKWDSGLQILLLLFAAVTLGGLGTAFGALIGALIIGMVVEMSPALGMPGDFKYATALLILILLLVVRPQGLLGRAQRVG